MKKKLLSAVGVGIGLMYSYYKGFQSGYNSAYQAVENDEMTPDESISVEVDPDDTTQEDNEDDDSVECKDENCGRTFDTERGMKIHYGREHDN